MAHQNSRLPSCRLALVSILVSLTGSFHFGMQLTATNPSHDSFLHFLNNSIHSRYGVKLNIGHLEALWSLIVALLFVGAIFGSLLIRPLSDRLGRLRSLLLGNLFTILCLAGCTLSFFQNSFEFFALARLGLGFCLALCLGLAGIFLAECSPKRCRGSVSMATGILLQMGTIFGSLLGIPSILGSTRHWWTIFGLEGLQLFLTTLLLFFIAKESPGFLLRRGKEEEACQSIYIYHNCKSEEECENRLGDLKMEMMSQTAGTSQMVGIRKLIGTSNQNRRAAIVGFVVALSMAFTGIAVINAFAVQLFRATGLNEMWATMANVGLSILCMVANIFSALLIDRFGRRPLMLTTLCIILAVNIAISGLMVGYEKTRLEWLGVCLIGAIAVFVVAFAFGPGPLCYFLPAELVEQNVRSAAQGFATLGQMLSRAALLSIFLPLRNWIGGGIAYFALFVFPIFLALVYLFYRLPETKNRNLSEVRREMLQLPRTPLKRIRSKNIQKTKKGWNNVIVNANE